jgi:translocation and assembly module TamB
MSLRRKIILLLIAAILLIPSAALYWVATTEAGLRFVANRIGKVGPVTITAQDVRGTLTSGVRIESLRILHRRSDMQISKISAQVELLPLLLLRHINVVGLSADRVSIKLLPDPNPNNNWEPRFLPATLRIETKQIKIREFELTLLSGRVLTARQLVASAIVYPKRIQVNEVELDYDLAHVTGSGNVIAARPFGLNGKVSAHYVPTDLPDWVIRATLDGNLDKLPISAHIEKPFHADVEGAATALNTRWLYAATAKVKDFDLVPFGGGDALGVISGTLDIGANNDGFTAKGMLTPPGLEAGPLAVTFDGSYADKHVLIRSATATHAASHARLNVRGDVNITGDGPHLALQGHWTQFRWPLAANDPAFSSPKGEYKLDGLKPWNLQAQGDVVSDEWPVIPFAITGILAGDSLHIQKGSAQVYKGKTEFIGEARWNPTEQWQLQGKLSGLETSQLRGDLPGTLGFNYIARGAPFGESGTIELDISNLKGQLRGQAAGGKGRFTQAANSEDWIFHDVDVRFGRTRIALDGGLGSQADLRFRVEADDLSLLSADAKGHVNASGRFAGTTQAPIIILKAEGANFAWQDLRLKKLDADLNIDLASSGQTQGHIRLTEAQLGNRTAQSATLQLSGTAAAQRMSLSLDVAPLRTSMVAQGVFSNGLWQGEIQSLTVDDARDLHLKLDSPAPLRFNAERIAISTLCLKGAEVNVCADAERLANTTWQLNASSDGLPLRALTAGLTQNVDYEGTINLQAQLAGSARESATGAIRGQLQNAQIRHRLSNGRDERLALGTGSVNATANPDSFSVVASLDAGGSGNFQGELNGQRVTQDWRNYPIRGSLRAATDGLGLLDIYLGGIDKATGKLNTQVTIGGTLGRPDIQGQLQIRDASIDLLQVSLALRALTLDATFDATALTLSGQSKLGEGQSRFNGKLSWQNSEPFGNLHVEGDNLRIVNVPEARIDASPKLDFKLEGHRVSVSGEVKVPYARLEPADLTDAVLPSNDEVLVGAPEVDPTQRWTILSDIRMVLGDSVNINSQGLIAKLAGQLVVRTDESQISRGQGELSIAEGKYSALGRQLDIERGRLLFNNVPLGDPAVDLRAQKVFPDITAGVNVRGSLRAPRMTFFSEPAIPQNQIASLILAGGSLESVQNSARAGAARNDLIAQGSAILAQQVGSRVGVDDVGIESDLNRETALVLGKYLSPKLYVSYGISLAEAINTLKLRYTIGDRWTIKTEAGKERSADIVYTIQK